MSFDTPKVPDVVPPPNPATMADPSIAAAAAKQQNAYGGGLPSTLMTGGQGLFSSASTSSKSLFGQ